MDTPKNQLPTLRPETLPLAVQPTTLHLINSIIKNDRLAIKEAAHSLMEKGAVKYEALLSIPQSNRLQQMQKVLGTGETHLLIVILIDNFINSYNVEAKPSAEQVLDAAYDLLVLAKQYHCAFEDLVVFFECAKRGTYGKVYNRIDGPLLMEFFNKYLDERYEAFREWKINEENEFKAQYCSESREISQNDKLERRLIGIAGALDALKEKLDRQNHYPNSKLTPKEIKHPFTK